MHWGLKIVLSFVLFISFILYLLFRALNEDFYLVTDDYYQQDIIYQSHIDKIDNARALSDPIKIDIENGNAILTFSPLRSKKTIEGEIHFFRPSNATLDFRLPIKLNDDSQQIIAVKSLKKGLWKVKINWGDNEKEYYQEKILVI